MSAYARSQIEKIKDFLKHSDRNLDNVKEELIELQFIQKEVIDKVE